MYICFDCGAHFDTPATIKEYHTELAERPSEGFFICPGCGGDNFEELRYCHKCGGEMPESQDAYGLCESCEADARKRFKADLRGFTQNELDYLDCCIDGRTLYGLLTE